MWLLFVFSSFFCTFAPMEDKKRQIVFIVNPISGTRSKDGLEAIIKSTLDASRFDWRIEKTQRAGHAVEIATKCADDGVDICAAVGGDGTVNEVARALVHRETALAIIPCGSGNGLARHLCLPMSMKGSMRILNECCIRAFDYGIVNDQPFFCTCGLGFDAHVALKFAESGKRGLSTYAKMVMSEGMSYKPLDYTIQFEGEEPQKFNAFLVDVANAAQYGNNTYIAPGASIQDGVLDVVIANDLKVGARPKMLTDLFMKTIRTNKHIQLVQTTRLHIHRDEPGPFQIDGDPFMSGTDFDIQIMPGGLKAVTNPKKIEDSAKPNSVIHMLSKIHI